MLKLKTGGKTGKTETFTTGRKAGKRRGEVITQPAIKDEKKAAEFLYEDKPKDTKIKGENYRDPSKIFGRRRPGGFSQVDGIIMQTPQQQRKNLISSFTAIKETPTGDKIIGPADHRIKDAVKGVLHFEKGYDDLLKAGKPKEAEKVKKFLTAADQKYSGNPDYIQRRRDLLAGNEPVGNVGIDTGKANLLIPDDTIISTGISGTGIAGKLDPESKPFRGKPDYLDNFVKPKPKPKPEPYRGKPDYLDYTKPPKKKPVIEPTYPKPVKPTKEPDYTKPIKPTKDPIITDPYTPDIPPEKDPIIPTPTPTPNKCAPGYPGYPACKDDDITAPIIPPCLLYTSPSPRDS